MNGKHIPIRRAFIFVEFHSFIRIVEMLEKTLTDKLCKCRNKKKTCILTISTTSIHYIYLFIT